ncbi:MAG: hypothetical protein R2697_10995 [Ilumatobacteraceae bacterium]
MPSRWSNRRASFWGGFGRWAAGTPLLHLHLDDIIAWWQQGTLSIRVILLRHVRPGCVPFGDRRVALLLIQSRIHSNTAAASGSSRRLAISPGVGLEVVEAPR